MKEYTDLVHRKHIVTSSKPINQIEVNKLDREMLAMELRLPTSEIILSVREAFRHIPPRL